MPRNHHPELLWTSKVTAAIRARSLMVYGEHSSSSLEDDTLGDQLDRSNILHFTSKTLRRTETASARKKTNCEQKKAPFSISTQARLSERGPLPSACFGVYVHLAPLSVQPDVVPKLPCFFLIVTLLLSLRLLLYAEPAASALWSSSLA
jgi:hypothetical protein